MTTPTLTSSQFEQLQDIRKDWQDSKDRLSILLYGDEGTGKTLMAATARKPIYFMVFDKDGAIHLDRELIDSGAIFVDNRFQGEDPDNPTKFDLWDREVKSLISSGLLDHFGTLVIDSLTSLSTVATLKVMLQSNNVKNSGGLSQAGYGAVLDIMARTFTRLGDVPCHLILTAHEEKRDPEGDKVEKKQKAYAKQEIGPAAFKSLRRYVATLCAETWRMERRTIESEEGGKRKNVEKYLVRTKGSEGIIAKTRIGRNAFRVFEEPDVQDLLKRAGWEYENLPLLGLKNENK